MQARPVLPAGLARECRRALELALHPDTFGAQLLDRRGDPPDRPRSRLEPDGRRRPALVARRHTLRRQRHRRHDRRLAGLRAARPADPDGRVPAAAAARGSRDHLSRPGPARHPAVLPRPRSSAGLRRPGALGRAAAPRRGAGDRLPQQWRPRPALRPVRLADRLPLAVDRGRAPRRLPVPRRMGDRHQRDGLRAAGAALAVAGRHRLRRPLRHALLAARSAAHVAALRRLRRRGPRLDARGRQQRGRLRLDARGPRQPWASTGGWERSCSTSRRPAPRRCRAAPATWEASRSGPSCATPSESAARRQAAGGARPSRRAARANGTTAMPVTTRLTSRPVVSPQPVADHAGHQRSRTDSRGGSAPGARRPRRSSAPAPARAPGRPRRAARTRRSCRRW